MIRLRHINGHKASTIKEENHDESKSDEEKAEAECKQEEEDDQPSENNLFRK
mgnify:CR=1 FL=1